MSSIKKIFRKEVVVVVVAVIITTVGIRASDSLKTKNDMSNDGCGEDMVFVPSSEGGFCIDIYEASAGEDCLYRDEYNIDKTRINLKTEKCSAASIGGAVPWRYISRDQAALACAKSGKRLATAKEWYQASLGTPDIDRGWGVDDCQVSSNWADQPGSTGSGKNCVSSVGAYDMVGNVWEWVDGTITDAKYKDTIVPGSGYVQSLGVDALPAVTDDSANVDYYNDYFWSNDVGVRAIARGGSWINKKDAGQYAVYAEADTAFIGNGIGFRCAK
jgi:hypothetical protein